MKNNSFILGLFLTFGLIFSSIFGWIQFTPTPAYAEDDEGLQIEMMDPDEIYPPGVKIKISYEADKDLFHLIDIEDLKATQLYATPEDLAFAIPSIAHIAKDKQRRKEMNGSHVFTIEEGLPLFHPDDIAARVKSLKKGDKVPASVDNKTSK